MSISINPTYKQVLGQLNLADMYIQQLMGYYNECYLKSEIMQSFVKQSPHISEELRSHNFIGVSDRTLGLNIPKTLKLTGGAMRGTMQTVGLIHPSGSELFRGCIVFPEIDEQGNVNSAVGYRFGKRIRHWQQEVIHWEKPALDGYIHDGLAFIKEVIYGKAYH